jgi:hypothetical protein
MLAEWLLYALTRVEPWVDKMGYREGAVRLWSRARRCRTAWAAHTERTRAEVLAGIEACARRRTALILGSGVLSDVPLAELSARFERVVLADIVHLPTIKWRANRFANVTLATVDLTGVGQGLAASTERPWPAPGSAFGHDDPTIDYVVSLNLVSQLPLTPCDRVETALGLAEGAADAYGQAIVAAHFAHLRGFRGRVLVLGDRQRVYRDREGRVFETEDALFGVPIPAPDAEWDWDVAPLGEADRRYSIRNRVFCVRELRDSK